MFDDEEHNNSGMNQPGNNASHQMKINNVPGSAVPIIQVLS